MGQLPAIFEGDRTDAERFVTDLQMYVNFNRHCANILDYRDKVRFALTLIQGHKVKGWKVDTAAWVNRQHDDLITWQDFLRKFGKRFLDSQREQTAKTKIEHVSIKDNDMDQYISLFEELANEANYDLDSKPVMNLFQRGLNYKLNNCIFSFDPPYQDWDDLKRMAMLASNAEANIKAFNQQPFGRNPGNYKGRQGDRSYGDRPQQRQYNSTTAPPSHNNRVVPMDIGRARGWRAGPAQGNATIPVENNATQPPARSSRTPARPTKFQGKCWYCDIPGHTRKECRKQQRDIAASTNWEQPPEAQLVDLQPTDNRSNPIDAIIRSFAALSTGEQDELAARFQQNEDFTDA
jgi:translation initiation factor 2 beta subunit (eIF-2beta)/eIF-5